MVQQNAVSLQIPVIPEKLGDVTKVLEQGGNPQMDSNTFFDFTKISTVHFARWIVVPPDKDLNLGPSLIYSANIDGSKDQHLNDVVSTLGEDLDAIGQYCTGYPAEGSRTKESRLAFMKKNQIKTPGFYVGAPNRSVKQVHQEKQLQYDLQQFLKDNAGKFNSSQEAYSAIKDYIKAPKFDWAREKYHLPRKAYVRMFFFTLLLLAIIPFLIIFILIVKIFYESRAKPFGVSVNQLNEERLAKLKSQEDIILQNQLSQVFVTKGGLRRLGLRFFLWSTTNLGKLWFVGGQLLGTPTIHFARWVLIDGGKRFVFFSNFDGSFDMYLSDFVDHSGWGLNAIYGAAKGYPKTSFLFLKGAYIILEFMGWGRKTQVASQIWYSAYPWTGLQQKVNNSKLRVELFNTGTLNEKQIKEMMRRI